jgi:HTH-type transcriptional regulator, transcriptional repressor of NAD biosynthesis genes
MKVSILGAECTGKSQLAQALAQRLEPLWGPVNVVPEYLREWCDTHGRTPRAHEQAAIATEQLRRMNASTARCTVADTSPIVTAVYSELMFQDLSLYPGAIAAERSTSMILLTGLDLPWLADGIQRDGVAMQQQFDTRLREVLTDHHLAYATIYGQGAQRVDAAMAALQSHLHPPSGQAQQASLWCWNCEHCSDAGCERRLFRGLVGGGSVGV